MLRDRGVLVKSLSDRIDPATSTGRLMLNMLATPAEYERELIVERVKAGVAAAKQNGTRFGRPLSDSKVIADKLAVIAMPVPKDGQPKKRSVSSAGAVQRFIGTNKPYRSATLRRPRCRMSRSSSELPVGLRGFDFFSLLRCVL